MASDARKLEALIWCPKCNTERFRLWSLPAQGNGSGHRMHRLEPTPVGNEHKQCFRCGANLERQAP